MPDGTAFPGRKVTGRISSVVNSSAIVKEATEDKPKNGEFPLDHILPVFNLNKKDSKFIPTLKAKQKDS